MRHGRLHAARHRSGPCLREVRAERRRAAGLAEVLAEVLGDGIERCALWGRWRTRCRRLVVEFRCIAPLQTDSAAALSRSCTKQHPSKPLHTIAPEYHSTLYSFSRL